MLNQPAYRSAEILVAGDNFGCGSSREHAPWALLDFGIRCVIAPSFADIFYNNCFKNGILPIVLPQEQVDLLMDDAERGANAVVTIDLEKQTITGARRRHDHLRGRCLPQALPAERPRRHRPDAARHVRSIDSYETSQRGRNPGCRSANGELQERECALRSSAPDIPRRNHAMSANKKLLLLPGDGIGPEVMRQVRRVIDWMDRRRKVTFDVRGRVWSAAPPSTQHGAPITRRDDGRGA